MFARASALPPQQVWSQPTKVGRQSTAQHGPPEGVAKSARGVHTAAAETTPQGHHHMRVPLEI